MQKMKKAIAVLMMLVLMLQVTPAYAAETVGEESTKKIYVFELEEFINTLPSSKLQYDYLKVATAIQGLANRETPQLYYFFINGDEARINFNNTDVDEYWLEHLSTNDKMLAGYERVTVTDFWQLFELFADCYDGIVLWDEEVPATSNVASTIAGVENLLPVRYATGEDDLYTVMKEKNVTKNNEKSLVDKFTGEGTIPDSSTPSTGSVRTDAYIWAKEQYLDKGLTNPLLMTYSIDGGSWAYEDDGQEILENDAEFLQTALPETVEPGEIVRFRLKVKNTGTATWGQASYYRLGKEKDDGFGLYLDAAGETYNSSNKDRLYLTEDVEAGEEYYVEGYLKAPETEGIHEIFFSMVLDGTGYFGDKLYCTINVQESVEAELEMEDVDASKVDAATNSDTTTRNAEFSQAALPTTMKPGEIVKFCIEVKNTGAATWTKTDYYRFGMDTSSGFGLYLDAAGKTYNSSSYNRLFLTDEATVVKDGTYIIEGYLKAPEKEGIYNIYFRMVKDGSGNGTGWFGQKLNHTISVQAFDLEMEDIDAGKVTIATNSDKATRNAEFLQAALPTTMEPGEISRFRIKVKNTGTVNWERNSYYRFALATANGFGLYLDETGETYNSSSYNRLYLTEGVESGEEYYIEGYLKAPETEGIYDIDFRMVTDGSTGYFGDKLTHTIEVAADNLDMKDVDDSEVTAATNSDTEARNAEFLQAALPITMKPGEIVKFGIIIKNTGTTTWEQGSYYRFGKATNDGFGLYLDKTGLEYNSSNKDRLYLTEEVETGEEYYIEGYLKAPETEGTYNIFFRMVTDGSGDGTGWFGEKLNISISVENELDMKDIESSGVVYDNIWQTALPNADYYIAEKAFFWDLSPDGTIAPIDDRSQPIGADLAALEKILLSQAQQAEEAAETGKGYGFYTVGGFVPWFLKYSNSADSQSGMKNVDAEWAMIEIISSFHGEIDADAYGTISMSNGSVFCHGQLDVDNETGTMVQNNNKETIMATDASEIEYDPDTAYIMFFMGDWDGAAWVNGILPFIWEESRQDVIEHPDDPIPLAWPINYIVTNRVPHVYNMLYNTMTSFDYFVSGDNGTGYLNPMYLEEELMGAGITESYLDEWVAYNKYAYNLLDLDITGWLMEHSLGDSTETVRQAYTEISPCGVIMDTTAHETIVTKDAEGNVISETPFPEMILVDSMRTEALRQSTADKIAANIKFDGQFFAYHSVKASRANIRATLELLEEQNPGIKYKVVDPYTFMKLYAEYGGNSDDTVVGEIYETTYATNTVTVDGVIGTEEWNNSNAMTVNTSADEISNHGFIWGGIGDTSDLDVEYRLMWDENNLYLLENRTDNYIKYNYNVGSTPLYDIDASMFYLDLDDKEDGSKYFEGDFAIHYSVQSDGTVIAYLRTGSEDGTKNHVQLTVGTNIQISYQGTENGYVFEMAIPWNLFTNEDFSYMPDVNTVVGMTVLAIDHDEATSGGRQIMWHGNGDTQENWGTMKLTESSSY